MRWLVLAIFIACAAYIHGRGKVRHGFFRQLPDHSTFMSALNGFICLISRVPSSHYLQSTFFPELARSGRIGNAIRAGAIALLALTFLAWEGSQAFSEYVERAVRAA